MSNVVTTMRLAPPGLLLGLVLLLAGTASTAGAQGFRTAADIVQWSVQAVPEAVAPGGDVQLRLTAEIGEGWKMYALDSPRPSRGVEVELDELPEAVARAEAFRQAEPKQGFDPNFGIDVRYFEGRAELTSTLRIAADAAPGQYDVGGRIQFMVCDATQCLPPTKVPFAAIVAVEAAVREGETDAVPQPGGASAEPEASGPADASSQEETVAGVPEEEAAAHPASPQADRPGVVQQSDLEAARSGGLWGFLLLAIGAGLAALLTPCVFPMIPLTVSYFTRHAEGRRAPVRMAGVYGLAIVLTFTGLGALMALLVGAAGAQSVAANPWVNLFIGLVFVVFALSLLGLFELRLPSGLLNYFNRQGSAEQGYVGVLFMGLTLTLVSFSCTAPFVGGLLAATVQGEWSYPILGMLVFSATFALPFVVFALFPKGLHALPRSGSWMNAVKVVLGFVELAAALKFLSNADLVWGWNLISRPLAIALTVVIFFLTGLYLLGKLRLAHEPPLEQVGVVRLMCAITFFGISLYMLPGLLGAPLGALDAYLPPRQATDVSLLAHIGGGPAQRAGQEDFAWYDDIETAFAVAAQEQKPVFIDFTGYTCTNCRAMEANVFPRSQIAERFERDFVLLRLYTDEQGREEALQRYQFQLTGTTALPTYAIVDPHSRGLLARRSGMASVSEFAAFLEQGTASFLQRGLALHEGAGQGALGF